MDELVVYFLIFLGVVRVFWICALDLLRSISVSFPGTSTSLTSVVSMVFISILSVCIHSLHSLDLFARGIRTPTHGLFFTRFILVGWYVYSAHGPRLEWKYAFIKRARGNE